jgi:hypothetical protein
VAAPDAHKVAAPRLEKFPKGLQQLPRRVGGMLVPGPVQFLDQGNLASNARLPLPNMALGLSESILRRVHALLQSGSAYGNPTLVNEVPGSDVRVA